MTLEVKPANRRRVDRYELLELIGEGGMGAVYRALDTRLGRTVALKTVLTTPHGTAAFNQELRQRFMREALAASKVEHRNVVQVIDFGVAEDGTPYLVMEYLRGTDLAGLLKDTPNLLPIDQVADIMLNVCAALRACHQAGIVHRDLKPSNIFLAETDTGPAVKVLDFGVSKAPIAGDLTQEGQILGTPQYLSPEQVNGRVGPESDQYALGVLLYVCLTNRLPFEEHQNLSLLRAIEAGRFPSPRVYRPELPEALEAIVLRAMHVDGKQRFESVHALGQALWPFASTRGQIEWKNYYFHATPPVAPHQATVPVVPPRTMDRTALLPPPEGTPGLTTPQPPQMMVSTRLSKPTPPRADGAEDRPDLSLAFEQPARRRRAAAIWAIVACVVAALVAVGVLSRRGSAPAERPPVEHPSVAPPPATEVPSPAEPPPPVHPQVVQPPPPAPEAAPARASQAKPPRRRPPHGRVPRGPTSGGDRPGIDNNGIGIPND
ncbi:MAG TPA: serine/threonine-protein kinase [Polyangia bacterium]|nr:serine/threonine-protein kinase [Polyangia bacterium]